MKGEIKMKIKIKARPCGLMELYETAAKEYIKEIFNGEIAAVDFSEYKFDCSRINVANNIQDILYEYYTVIAKKEDDTISHSDIKIGITMLLVMSGPKVDKNLANDEVEIFEGFIC
jgi:hypothetical protein